MGTNPLDDIPAEKWDRLTPEQKEVLTLRFTTFLPLHARAKKLGINRQLMSVVENKALRLLTQTKVNQNQYDKIETSAPTSILQGLSDLGKEIHSVIGEEALIKVIGMYSGCRLYIPQTMDEHNDHPLEVLIGVELSIKMAEYFGGESLHIPQRRIVDTTIRNQRIRQRYDNGERVRIIAVDEKLGERAVYRILNRENREARNQKRRAKAEQ